MKRIVSTCLILVMLMGLYVPASAAEPVRIKIGDYLQLGVYLGEPIIWRCVDIDENGPLMLSKDILCHKPFDAKGTSGSHQRDFPGERLRQRDGSNFYPDSQIKSWLNSSALPKKIQWLCGNEPYFDYCLHDSNFCRDEGGFMRSFSATAKQYIKKGVKQKYVLPMPDISLHTMGTEPHYWDVEHNYDNWEFLFKNYDNAYAMEIEDRIFLLGIEQYHNMCENIGILGGKFVSGWISDAYIQSALDCEWCDTGEFLEDEEMRYYYSNYSLRTPCQESSTSNKYVSAYGWMMDGKWWYEYMDNVEDQYNEAATLVGNGGSSGIRPAFYLAVNGFTPAWGDGSEENPYFPYDPNAIYGDIDGFEDGVDLNYMPTDINKVTINGKGTAFGRFAITKTDGTPAKKMRVNYSVNGSNEKTTTTDNYGYAVIGIPEIDKSREFVITFRGKGIQPCEGTLSVTVEPLSFQGSYEAVAEAGVMVGAGIGVGGTIGKLEAEAKLADVGRTFSGKKSISLTQDYREGKNKITFTVKQNDASAMDAKAGLFAGLDAGIDGLDLSIGDASMERTVGRTVGVSYEDEDFNLDTPNDVLELSKFYLASLLECSPANALTRKVSEKLELPVHGRENGVFLTLDGGVNLGVVETKNGTPINEELGLVGLAGGITFDYKVKEDRKGAKTYQAGMHCDENLDLFSVKAKAKKDIASQKTGVNALGNGGACGVEFVAKQDAKGNLETFSLNQEYSSNYNISFGTETTTKTSTYTYDADTLKTMMEDVEAALDFSEGNKLFFSNEQLEDTLSVISNAAHQGTYSMQNTVEQGISFSLPVEVQVILDVGGEIGFSGIQSYTYESHKGIMDRAIYIQAHNEIEDEVKDKFLTVDEIFSLAVEKAKELLLEVIETAGEFIGEQVDHAIEKGKAKVQQIGDTACDWYVSISETIEDISPFALNRQGAMFSLAGEETETEAKTLGNPYVVSVADREGKPVKDLSENPLELTLSYTDEMLEDAGIWDESGIAVLYWDADRCAYFRQEAEADLENNCLKLQITKPGQYILGADTSLPEIKNLTVTKGKSPVVSAIITDACGIADFSMTLDGKEIINNDNVSQYYDSTTGEFMYQYTGTKAFLSGVLIVTDSFGNQTEQKFNVIVNRSTPQISEVTELPQVLGQETSLSAYVDGLYDKAYLHMRSVDSSGAESYRQIQMEEDIWMGSDYYIATIPRLKNGTVAEIWVEATTSVGNIGSSEPQRVVFADVKEGEPALLITRSIGGVLSLQAANLETDSETKALVGVYDQYGRLMDLKIKPYVDGVTFTDLPEGMAIKAFLWQDMKPLCVAQDVTMKSE